MSDSWWLLIHLQPRGLSADQCNSRAEVDSWKTLFVSIRLPTILQHQLKDKLASRLQIILVGTNFLKSGGVEDCPVISRKDTIENIVSSICSFSHRSQYSTVCTRILIWVSPSEMW